MNAPLDTEARVSLGWLLTRFTRETPSVAHALAISADGLALATRTALRRIASKNSLPLAAAWRGSPSVPPSALDAGGVRQTMVDMAHGLLLVRSVSDRAYLIVLAAADCDLAQVSYEAAVLARRVGAALTPAARSRYAAPAT